MPIRDFVEQKEKTLEKSITLNVVERTAGVQSPMARNPR